MKKQADTKPQPAGKKPRLHQCGYYNLTEKQPNGKRGQQ
tara:strand:+ start:1579 stop:1695 length:117 start_codon:yes stop_codon:yes gene_type:complete